MSTVRGMAPGAPPPARDAHAAVRKLAHQFEGVFLDQLFQAMRQSVPDGGFLGKSPGEEMFTAMMDEKIADTAAQRMNRGMGEALYRQLSKRLDASPEPDGGQTP